MYTWQPYHQEKNPNKKWYQFWKKRYVWIHN